jgi:ketosteroid isomerase-like protein
LDRHRPAALKDVTDMDRPDPTRRALLALSAFAPALTALRGRRHNEGIGSPESPDLAQAVARYNRATIGMDVETLGRLVTDDYMLVNSDSSVQDKQSYLADFRVPGFRLDPYVVEEPFHRIWGDAALTGGSMRLSWISNGQRQSRHLRFVHAWKLQNGRWRLGYSQLTRITD